MQPSHSPILDLPIVAASSITPPRNPRSTVSFFSTSLAAGPPRVRRLSPSSASRTARYEPPPTLRLRHPRRRSAARARRRSIRVMGPLRPLIFRSRSLSPLRRCHLLPPVGLVRVRALDPLPRLGLGRRSPTAPFFCCISIAVEGFLLNGPLPSLNEGKVEHYNFSGAVADKIRKASMSSEFLGRVVAHLELWENSMYRLSTAIHDKVRLSKDSVEKGDFSVRPPKVLGDFTRALGASTHNDCASIEVFYLVWQRFCFFKTIWFLFCMTDTEQRIQPSFHPSPARMECVLSSVLETSWALVIPSWRLLMQPMGWRNNNLCSELRSAIGVHDLASLHCHICQRKSFKKSENCTPISMSNISTSTMRFCLKHVLDIYAMPIIYIHALPLLSMKDHTLILLLLLAPRRLWLSWLIKS